MSRRAGIGFVAGLLFWSTPALADAVDDVLADARTQLIQGQAELVVQRLEHLRGDEPRWDVQFWLGTAYLQSGRLADASEALDQALSMTADRVEVWVQRAVVAQEQGDPRLALRFLDVAAGVDAEYPLVHLNAGVAWQSLGETARARAAYGRFLTLSSARPDSGRDRRLRREVLAQITAAD